jgi:transcriptional regulator with XRE-family HTH domain
MTFGEKLKSARKSAGLTQEELAEKLAVSRQAITKWESDKGMPDIENLKSLAKLMNVSIDYLLDDGESIDLNVTREEINLADYKGKKRRVGKSRVLRPKELIVMEKYPDADIYYLDGNKIHTKTDKIVDTVLWLLTDSVGVVDIINAGHNLDKEFYLVNQADKQYFVTVTNEFIESRQLAEKITDKKFSIGNFSFKVSYALPKE